MMKIHLIIEVILIKLLLIPLYYSTDFDVHRNWMRITTQQPIQQWYYDDQSIWTLDYPPLFAYLEFILGKIAISLNVDIYTINNKLIYFQRISVIILEFLYFYAIFKYDKTQKLYILLLAPFGSLLIDNIHFQYNGFLYGLLILICYYYEKQKYLIGSLLFTILLCFKHIYIYVVPAIAIYLLKNCSFQKIIKISLCCLALLLLIFTPFMSHIPQILKRMFPFQRGLVHAYWAQNFWSLYCFLDLVLGFIFNIKKSTTTSGIVQETIFNVLPQISAVQTLIVIGLLCLSIFKMKKSSLLNMCIVSSLIFFNFGYHVHEKAIMIPLILSLIGTDQNRKLVFMASYVNSVSLLPLIPTLFEQPILLILLVFYHILFYKQNKIQLNKIEQLYILFSLIVISSTYLCLNIQKFQFIPLILHSSYGALFNQYWLFKIILQKNRIIDKLD